MSTPTRYVWHHQLHEAWANERLYFWRLAFFPTYNEEHIRLALDNVLDAHEVNSYALYEIYGLYDIIVRVWLPTSTTPERFEEALTSSLTPFHMEVCDAFSVGQILRHWPWVEKDGSVKALDSELVSERLDFESIDKLNSLALGQEGDPEALELLHDKVEDGLLAKCSFTDGIKFLVVVTSSSQLATIAARGQLREELIRILKIAEDEGSINETSLYEGSGFGQFLLLGKVKPEEFSALRTSIIDRVNDAGTGVFFRARPYTYIAAAGDGKALEPKFFDRMPSERDSADTAKPIEEILGRDEDETLEIKASAFINIDRWLHTGRAGADDEITDKGVLKAIVGMLNRNGGTIIIGALEPERYRGDGGLERRLQDLPKVGKYLCLGIEPDYQGKDWDQWALRLQSVIMKRINPPPVGLVTISKVEVAGRALAVLSVQRTTREWFYLQGEKDSAEFFVRLDNSTRILLGPVADGYKQSYPRG